MLEVKSTQNTFTESRINFDFKNKLITTFIYWKFIRF
jgi:hypothetical protein